MEVHCIPSRAHQATTDPPSFWPQHAQDIPTIWWANALATGAAYGYAFTLGNNKVEEEEEDDSNSTLPAPLKAAFKVSGSGGKEGRC